jgi:hypothetical protein
MPSLINAASGNDIRTVLTSEVGLGIKLIIISHDINAFYSSSCKPVIIPTASDGHPVNPL